MGKHKDLEDIFVNELVDEEERAFRANRIIQHQEKLIENLERLLLSSHAHTKKGAVDTKDGTVQTEREKVELPKHDSSSYASFVCDEDRKYSKCIQSSGKTDPSRKKRRRRKIIANKTVPRVSSCQVRRASISTSLIPEYSRSEKTDFTVNTKSTQSLLSLCGEKSQKRLAANTASLKSSENQMCKNEMKNASGENASRVEEDSMARLVGLLQPTVCQLQDESGSRSRSHQRTSHSIVRHSAPNAKDILKLFGRIEMRLKNLQDDILNTRRDASRDNSRVQVIQNQLENMRHETISSNDLMMRLHHLRTQLENSVNELNWKIKGNSKFRDGKTHERWMTARKYFTAEQAYFLLTTTTEDQM